MLCDSIKKVLAFLVEEHEVFKLALFAFYFEKEGENVVPFRHKIAVMAADFLGAVHKAEAVGAEMAGAILIALVASAADKVSLAGVEVSLENVVIHFCVRF